MNEFDDIFNAAAAQPFDKDAWAAKKQAERQSVYELVDTVTKEVAADGGRLQQYLDVQARFGRYSVTNALLILAQRPQATRLRDFDGWKDAGMSVQRQQKGISILEPGNEYRREDGSTGVSYNVKKVFDISQTAPLRLSCRHAAAAKRTESSHKTTPFATKPDDRLLLKALIHHAPVPLQTVDKLPEGPGAYYDHDQQWLFVQRGLTAADIFRSVAAELAHVEIALAQDDYTRAPAAFPAYCASYLLCRQYGVDTGSYTFHQLPESLQTADAQSIRATLNTARDAAVTISSRMYRVLEQAKEAKTQETAR